MKTSGTRPFNRVDLLRNIVIFEVTIINTFYRMKILASFYCMLVVITMISCKSEEKNCSDCETTHPTSADSISTSNDEKLNGTIDAKEQEVQTKTQEQKENHDKIVKKFGEQWDFCKCIVTNDSITDAFEKNLTSEQETKLIQRMEYVGNKCKELLTIPNTTPEERTKHEKRVLKCLKANGLKK